MEINGLGNKLAQLRKKHNLTQREMADKLNVSNQLISKWETEQVIPGVEYLVKISELFDVSLDDLVLQKNKQTSPKKIAKKLKEFIKTYKKQLTYAIITLSSAILITAISLLSIFVFAPAVNKKNYLIDIEQCIYNYIEENDRFQIKIFGKRDGATISYQYLNGNIDEYGIDYKVYGDLGNVKEFIIDNIVYNNQYKTEYTGNITTIKELFNQKLAQDIITLLEQEYDHKEIPIKYIRKTRNGYFIKIDKNILINKLTTEEKKNLSFNGDLQGDIIIKEGIIEKIDLAITMHHKDSGNHEVQTLVEFSKEKPTFTPNTSPWYHNETISFNEFVSQTFSNYENVNISTNSETHRRLIDSILNQNIRYVDGKLWFTYYLSGLSKTYLVGLNVATGSVDYEQEIYNNYGFFYQDKFVVYDSSTLNMIDLRTQIITKTKFGKNSVSIYDTHRMIKDDYLIIKGDTNYLEPTYYLIYNLKDNSVAGKTSGLAYDEGTFSTNVMYKNKVFYYLSNPYNYGYNSDIIYSFNLDTKTETKLVSSLNGLRLRYIDNQGNLYYQDYNAKVIYKVGSSFGYAIGDIHEDNGLIYIINGNELFVYDGEQLISQTTYTPTQETIFEHKDVLFIDRENNLIYLKNKNLIYHGSFDIYDKLADIWLATSENGHLKSPLIVDCIDDYVITKINSAGTQYAIYKRLDVSRAYKITSCPENIDSGNYARLTLQDDTQILLLCNEIYLLSEKNA